MKKYIISLFMCLFTLIGFGYCDYLISNNSFTQNYKQNHSVQLNSSNEWKYTFSDYGIYCNKGGDYSGDIAYYKSDGTFIGWLSPNACIYGGGNQSYMYSNNHTNLNFYLVYMYLPGSIYTGNSNCEIMTSLECQLEYNLIPTDEVTENYCIINHNLIRPNDCPITSTGDIQRTPIFINNTQYQGANRLDIFINEDLQRTTTYESGAMEINVNGYNIDTNYINDIINKEKLTPTKEEFGNLLTGMKDYLPYIMVALLLGWTIRVLKKVFKF